mmetsp:Transcript_31610/g.66931  ORF Transcript_31610/g.66931 Transcript_31610/m.66931 type:complete len:87 (+) Transcript_31610:97-357(+)
MLTLGGRAGRSVQQRRRERYYSQSALSSIVIVAAHQISTILVPSVNTSVLSYFVEPKLVHDCVTASLIFSNRSTPLAGSPIRLIAS